MRSFKYLYLVLIVLFFIFLSLSSWGEHGALFEAYRISLETGIPNAVSGIYLQNRLYDTVFEVTVFSVAISGALFFLGWRGKYRLDKKINADAPMIMMLKGAAFLSFVFGCALVLVGHLSPGGGFAGGVALATSMVIQSLLDEKNRLTGYLSSHDPEKIEKSAWLLIILISAFTCAGSFLPKGLYGTVLSGGWIPFLNVLIGVKVGLGAWALSMGFLEHRWIF
ncbi:MAG: hypothetical protein JW971_04000 [Synergistales bacterium]|nr:hypothetical protein [Synergistales bacterium]